MPDIVHAVILGIVQGATEFLPVSSSGHLVIVPWLLGWPPSSLLFDTMLHWGTLLAVLMVFWRDLLAIVVASVRSLWHRSLADPNARLGLLILVGSVPVVAVGLLFKDYLEMLFGNARMAGFFLIITAGILALSERLARRITAYTPLDRISLRQVLIIGSAQAVALAPGISRSGSTIAAGLATGLRRDVAARFSFLLGAPAFLGAGLLQLIDATSTDSAQVMAELPVLIVGFVTSAIVGVIAIRFLLGYLRNHTLRVFVIYCLVVGVSVVILSFTRPI